MYIYILVISIFSVVACTITYFIKMYLLLPFLILFRWLQKFLNYVIFRSTYKTFPGRTFRTPVVRITSHTSFLLFLSDSFEFFPAEWLTPPQKVHLIWTGFSLSLFLPQPELISIIIHSVCKDETDKDF